MTGAMIENETFDELCFRGHAVLHFHDFDHVKVDGFGRLVDGEDGVNDRDGEGLSEGFGEFGCEGGAGDLQEEISINGLFNLELVQELYCQRGVTKGRPPSLLRLLRFRSLL